MIKRKLITLLGIAALLSSPIKSLAQAPLYAGYSGSNYAIQYKANEKLEDSLTGKFFSQNLPVWTYFGAPLGSDGIKEKFYGAGFVLAWKGAHILPTLEGYEDKLSGISAYTTLDLPKKLELDVVPHWDNNLRYTSTDLNVYRDFFGISLGLAASFDGKVQLTDLDQTKFQFGKYFKNWNVTGSINPKNKTATLALQRNF